MHRTIGRQDVIEGYRTILGREPENEQVIEMHLTHRLDVWQWVRILTNSDEARHYRLDCAAAGFFDELDGGKIDVDAAPEQLDRLLESLSSAWSTMGEEKPYWSVLVNEKYRTSLINDADREEFYASGANDVLAFQRACERNGLALDFSKTVLDLGCGLGRVGEHFARRFGRYIGVDVSPPHLRMTAERLTQCGFENATLSLLGDFVASRPGFDIFYSVIALQHSPPPVMLWLLRKCFAALRSGGYAFFQIPCHLYGYEFQLDRYLAELARHDQMEMHALPQRHIFRALAECGLVPVEVVPYPRIGPIGHSYMFLAQKLPG